MSFYCERKTKAEIMAGIEGVVKSRFIARNTVQYETKAGDLVTRLHLTDVVTKRLDGSFVLNTGGWATVTTRDRMNHALPGAYRVRTCKGALYVSNGKREAEFKQGAVIGPRGGLKTDIADGVADGFDSYRKKIDLWVKKLLAEGIPESGAGDPWVVPEADGKYAAEYVESWLDDSYVFRSLIVAALGQNMQPLGVRIWIDNFNRGDSRAFVTGKIRRYFRACLGFSI